MNLQALLNETLNAGTIGQISQSLGADEGTTSNAVQAALPLLLGALANNSSTSDGASSLLGALDRDHDGSVLDDVGGYLGNYESSNGAGILGHIFGQNQNAVANGVSQASGLDQGSTLKLLLMLAPLVMGALGRSQRQGGIDESGLSGYLGDTSRQMGGSTIGMLSQLLDSNRDGSALDDVLRIDCYRRRDVVC
jgi:hypothetical protein